MDLALFQAGAGLRTKASDLIKALNLIKAFRARPSLSTFFFASLGRRCR